MDLERNRLFVVSNRLPIAVDEDDKGNPTIQPAAGGLVTALQPILERHGGAWLGWPGSNAPEVPGLLDEFNNDSPFNLHAVEMSEEEVDLYYRGFSNQTVWPLFHDFLGAAEFHRHTWRAYQDVNRKFAEAIADKLEPDHLVWIHDYQLMLVGTYLREMGVTRPIAYFLHIPFPSGDIFRRLPWRREIARALLEYDMLGFQTERDRRNFGDMIRWMCSESKVRHHKRMTLIECDERTVHAGNFPISIDFREFDNHARSKSVSKESGMVKVFYRGNQLILGLDRLDYTKGIPERFRAYERLLEKYPQWIGKVTLIQVVVPSRTKVEQYQRLKERLDQMTGKILGRFSQPGWVPIHYFFKRLDREELLAHYRAADVAFVTPLRDGMNLVAKEYCASHPKLDGTLLLSEFAGSAEELKDGAVMVNPYDLEKTADALHQALSMSEEERRSRMKRLRRKISTNNVHRWVRFFMDAVERDL
ncbi:trehalose-6-phosphate synthase [bacterium]|nr:trehalose-6-phosphate synthase [bacterium]